jgi:Ca2+-binding RTX toxin-like protein
MSVRQSPRPSARPVVAEALEARQLLHAGHPELIGSTLVIEGLAGRDRIDVKLVDNKKTVSATINGVTETFQARRVAAVRVLGQGGKDRITIKGSLGRLPVTLSGGDGNDLITGNRDSEIINGDGGRDTINAGAGDDRIKGGGGNDLVFAGSGNDNVVGDSGHDGLYGDAGNDRLFGKGGNDTIGGDDEDTLHLTVPANSADIFGNDRLDGGDGDDVLLGGPANETTMVGGQEFLLPNSTGRDTFTGGAGADVLDARGGDDTFTDRTGLDFVPTQQFTPAREQPGDAHTHAIIQIHLGPDANSPAFVVPHAIGRYSSGLADLHTHNGTTEPAGRIHYESPDHSGYTLAEFFQAWGITFGADRVGRFASSDHSIRMEVNGAANNQFGAYAPQNGDTIRIFID